jgi:hypothetical protein
MSNLLILSLKDTVDSFEEIEVKNIKTGKKEVKYSINNKMILQEGDVIVKELTDGSTTDYYISNIQYDEGSKSLLIHHEKVNDVSIFILPLVIKTFSTENQLHERYFINAYLSKDKKNVILKYRYTTFESFSKLDSQIKGEPLFETIKFTEDKMFNLYYMKISYLIKEDVEKFIQGKFHDLSDKSKTKIVSFYGFTENEYFYQILYDDTKIRTELEQSLGVEIPKNISVRSKPEKGIWYE